MIEAFKNNFTVNKQGLNPYMNWVAVNNPVQSTTGILERSPQTDNVSISKQPMTKQTKVLLSLGGIATAVLGTVLAVKGYRSHQITKGLEKIEQKFLKLQENIPEVQSTFKKVFLRNDITEKETIDILNRYKEVEKIKITKTKEEYAKAVFNEAVQNYELKHANIKLVFDPIEYSKAGGFWQIAENSVVIKDTANKEWMFGAIHHELRHAKQSQAIFESLPREDVVSYFKKRSYSALKEVWRKAGSKPQDFETWEKEVWTPDFTKVIIDNVGNKLARKGIKLTDEQIKYAKKMQLAQEHYVGLDDNISLYWANDVEKDARLAETLINKLFGLNKSTVEFYAREDAKYLH